MNPKYAGRPIKSFSALAPYFYLTTRARTARCAWKFIFTILRDFFLLQMFQKFHFRNRHVVNVETELDNKIPFRPGYVITYLGFVPFFIRPIDALKKKLGYKKAAPYICLFLIFLTRIYRNASTIYRFCMSTTTRPKYFKNHHFRTIHIFDPHLLCVPSIHVAIAAGTYAWFKQCLKTDVLPEEEAESFIQEIKSQAVAITESVLFVKQHSVNCIPTALYMITATSRKSFFQPEAAADFINDLFLDSKEFSPETRNEIIEYFFYMYDRVLLESKFSSDWQECIQHWIVDYAKQTGQLAPEDYTMVTKQSKRQDKRIKK